MDDKINDIKDNTSSIICGLNQNIYALERHEE